MNFISENLSRFQTVDESCAYWQKVQEMNLATVHTASIQNLWFTERLIYVSFSTFSTESFAAELLATHMTLIAQLQQHRCENSRNSRVFERFYDVEDGTTCSKNIKIVSNHRVRGSRAYGLLPDYGSWCLVNRLCVKFHMVIFFSIMFFVLPLLTKQSTYFILIKVCHFVGKLKHK